MRESIAAMYTTAAPSPKFVDIIASVLKALRKMADIVLGEIEN